MGRNNYSNKNSIKEHNKCYWIMQRLRVSYKNLELLEIIQKTLCKAGAAP